MGYYIGILFIFGLLHFHINFWIFESLSLFCFPVKQNHYQVFNTEGEFLLKFGSNGEGNGQFNAPTGVAVDVNGNIIVADWGNSRIQVSANEKKGGLALKEYFTQRL